MQPIRSTKKNQRGSALLEFALCSVMLMLITVGATDFSRLSYTLDMATGAAAAGAQYASLSPTHWSDYTGIQNAAMADAGNISGMSAVAVQRCYCTLGGEPTTCPADCSTPYTYVKVSVTIPFTSVFSYPMMPHPTTLTANSMVRVQ